MLLELSCPGCQRTARQSRDVVLKRLSERKPPRCAFCGKELTLPADLPLPELAPLPPATVMGRCPVCLKSAMLLDPKNVDGGTVGRCGACGSLYLCERPAHGSFDVPVSEGCSRAELDAAGARLARLRVGKVLQAALEGRAARKALAAGEAAHLLDCLEALGAWRAAGSSPFLPLPRSEVLSLLGHVVLASSNSVVVDEEQNLVRLRSTEVFHHDGLGAGSKAALNVVGVGLLLTTGAGFTVSGGGPRSEHLTAEQVIVLEEVARGCALHAASSQNGGPLVPFSQEEQSALAASLFAERDRLMNYVRLLMIFGARFRGSASRRITREHVSSRLKTLGISAEHVAQTMEFFAL